MMHKSVVVIGGGVAGIFACLYLVKQNYDVTLISPTTQSKKLFQKDLSFSSEINARGNLKNNFNRFLAGDLKSVAVEKGSDLFEFPTGRELLSDPQTLFNTNIELRQLNFKYFTSNKLFGLGDGWGANIRRFSDSDIARWSIKSNELYKYESFAEKYFHLNDQHSMNSRNYASMKRFSNALNSFATVHKSNLAISREKCIQCGLCVWGCSQEAIFSPRDIYPFLIDSPNFKHINGFADELISENDKISGVLVRCDENLTQLVKAKNVVLAGGPLSSFTLAAKLLNKTQQKKSYETTLLDTRCAKIPLIDFSFYSNKYNTDRIMFNELIFDWQSQSSNITIQGEIMKLNAMLTGRFLLQKPLNPILNHMILRLIVNRLYAITIFANSDIENSSKLKVHQKGHKFDIEISEHNASVYDDEIKLFLKRLRSKFFRNRFYIPGGGAISNAGTGIHYAGTLPMSRRKHEPLKTSEEGKLNQYSNVWIADSSIFPDLPSKSLTYTIACNAMRVASYV